MQIIELGKQVSEKVLLHPRGNKWLIDAEKNVVLIGDGDAMHRDLLYDAKLADPSNKFPSSFDGSIIYQNHDGKIILTKDVTSSTSPIELQGMELGTIDFDRAMKKMRQLSAQMLAESMGEPITALFRDGTSEIFFP